MYYLVWFVYLGRTSLYWISPWIIMSTSVENPPMFLGITIVMFTIGIFFHFAADMQKYIHIKLKPGELITDGLMANCRNTNYFGELLIYLSYALLSRHWLPLVVLASFIVIIWFPNMRRKDKSLSRYPGYKDYKEKTFLLIPFLW